MDDLLRLDQGAAGEVGRPQAPVLALAHCREALDRGRGDSRHPGSRVEGRPRRDRRDRGEGRVEGVQSIALHEFGQQGGQGGGAVEEVEPDQAAVDGEQRAALPRPGAEGGLIAVQPRAMTLVERRGGMSGGVDAHAGGFIGDVGPHAPLIALAGAAPMQRLADIGGLAGAAAGVVGAAGAGELGGLGAPAPGLDAGDGDDDGPARRGQDAEVEDAVLLGADQFLAVQQQHRQVAVVDEAQLRHAAALAEFGDPGGPVRQGLVEEPVARLLRSRGQQGVEGEVEVLQGGPQGYLSQTVGDHGHARVLGGEH